MPNNVIQFKRTTTTGNLPNTTNSSNGSYIPTGSFAINLTDKTVVTSDGTNIIYVGSNTVNHNVTNAFTLAGSTVSSINAVSNSSQLGMNSNNELVTSYAIQNYVSSQATVSAGGGSGTANINFGSTPGNNFTTVTFSNTQITSNSIIQAFMMASDSTTDHTANDHLYASMFITFSCQANAGVGGIINAMTPYSLFGTFAVRYKWQ